MLLTGCFASTPKPEITATQTVDQPADCERILQTQPVVKKKLGDDYRKLLKKAQAGQILENKIIVSGRECMAKQRELYAEAK